MENPELADTAGVAFQRITGAEDIEGEKSAATPAEEISEEAEFRDEAPPPDAARARVYWERHQPALHPNARWQGGLDVGAGVVAPGFDDLGLDARRDVYLGARARALSPDRELEARAAVQLASGRPHGPPDPASP